MKTRGSQTNPVLAFKNTHEMTYLQFAHLLAVTPRTARSWCISGRDVPAVALRLVEVLEASPDERDRRIAEAKCAYPRQKDGRKKRDTAEK
jgi:DNA-binding transcriptional regulator YiaG